MPTPGRRRLSITKLQRETAAGAELLALCQTVTADGHLTDEEVASLRQWLEDHAATDLPAVGVLLETVRRILADGRVTDEERRELHQTIETVLPRDVREAVRDRRQALEADARAQATAARATAREEARADRRRNTPVRSWNFMVAGFSHAGRPTIISAYAHPGDDVFAVRDPENRHSPHATEIRLRNGMSVGWVPEHLAGEVAPLLDAGHPHLAWMTKILTGGRSPIPVVQLELYPTDTTAPDVVTPAQVPPRAAAPGSGSRHAGCLGEAAVLVALVVALALLA